MNASLDYSKGKLSGFDIKLIAVISMIIDHVGSHIIRNWYLLSGYNIFTQENIKTSMLISNSLKICDALGSIAFPLFCFLIAEGYLHTHNPRRYALRLFIFAVISEIPFNLVHKLSFTYPGLQNVMFTLAISILTLNIASLAEKKCSDLKKFIWLRIGIIILGMGAAFVARGEYVFLGVLAIALFYYLHDYRYLRLLAFIPLAVPSFWSLLAVPAVFLYNGSRGRPQKYFFYIFYPAHFLLIYAVMKVWLKM